MKQLVRLLLIIIFVINSALVEAMECINYVNTSQLPKELIAELAGYCTPREKNVLMKVCKDFYACLKDRTLILQANPSTVGMDEKERDIIRYAYINNVKMMQFLLAHGGVSVNVRNRLGMTLFHIAYDNKSEEAMQLLRKHGADEKIEKPEVYPLHEAAYKGDEETVKKLLEENVLLNRVCKYYGRTALYLAVGEGHIGIVKLLLEDGASINQATKHGNTPLQMAVTMGHTEIVELLIKRGVKVDVVANDGYTPLVTALSYGNSDIAQLLIDAHADIDQLDKMVYCAAYHGPVERVKLLIAFGANVNHQADGWTPLLMASYGGNFEIVKLLIGAKAHVHYQADDGWTPLCVASYYGAIEIVKLLLDAGADQYQRMAVDSTIDPAIKKGDTALQIAQKKGHSEVEKILQEHLQREKISGYIVVQDTSKKKKKTVRFSNFFTKHI